MSVDPNTGEITRDKPRGLSDKIISLMAKHGRMSYDGCYSFLNTTPKAYRQAHDTLVKAGYITFTGDHNEFWQLTAAGEKYADRCNLKPLNHNDDADRDTSTHVFEHSTEDSPR